MVNLDVQTAIEDVIRERLSSVRIVRVDTVRDEDFDGDDVLRIVVLVDSPASEFDTKRLSGLVRHIRERLDSLREHAFPLVSFRPTQNVEGAH